MYAAELPQVEPRWQTRPLTPAEVVRLVTSGEVSGVNPHDARVQAIRCLQLSNLGRLALGEAQRCGYLRYVTDDTLGAMTADTLTAWSWWCAAACHPEIVLHEGRGGGSIRVTADLSSSGRVLLVTAMWRIGQAIAETHTEDGWLLTREEVQIGGLDNQSALALARTLLDIVQDRRIMVDREWATQREALVRR